MTDLHREVADIQSRLMALSEPIAQLSIRIVELTETNEQCEEHNARLIEEGRVRRQSIEKLQARVNYLEGQLANGKVKIGQVEKLNLQQGTRLISLQQELESCEKSNKQSIERWRQLLEERDRLKVNVAQLTEQLKEFTKYRPTGPSGPIGPTEPIRSKWTLDPEAAERIAARQKQKEELADLFSPLIRELLKRYL